MQLDFLDPQQLKILAEVVLAMILGSLIGLDREMAAKPAGLRTHMLVAGAATLFVGLGSALVVYFTSDLGQGLVGADPIRIVEAVITGVSFLGAGTIIRRAGEGQVEGLTTAASLLFSAAMGVAVALEQFVLAAGVTLLALLILRGVSWLERRATRLVQSKKPD